MHWVVNEESDIQPILYGVRLMIENVTSEVKVTEVITICSELLFNVIKYGKSGDIHAWLEDDMGLMLEVSDHGPGFSISTSEAFREGYSSAKSLGLGLPSVVRLSDAFELSTSCTGTAVKVFKEL